MGGFTRACDLISSEYGWTDDIILDLTVGRVRQITAAIAERKILEFRREKSLLEWQTKAICNFLVATAPLEVRSEELVAALNDVTLDPSDKQNSEARSDDNSSERPVKYASQHAMSQFARGLMGGPMQAW